MVTKVRKREVSLYELLRPKLMAAGSDEPSVSFETITMTKSDFRHTYPPTRLCITHGGPRLGYNGSGSVS